MILSVNAKQLEQPVFQAGPLLFAKRTPIIGQQTHRGLGNQIGVSPITDANLLSRCNQFLHAALRRQKFVVQVHVGAPAASANSR